MKILFSPVWDEDPLTSCNDGPMIHICRHELPDEVRLFLAREALAKHRQDDRYRRAIRLLEKNLAKMGTVHRFDVKIITDMNVMSMHDFDEVYSSFMEKLKQIESENDGAKILLNVSSGTRAMRSALQVAACNSDKYVPLQVAPPDEESAPEQKMFDLEELWGKNVDACEKSHRRVSKSPKTSVISDVERRMILRHAKSYEYEEAWNVIWHAHHMRADNLFYLIDAARKRMRLDKKGAESALKKVAGIDISDILQKNLGLEINTYDFSLYEQLNDLIEKELKTR